MFAEGRTAVVTGAGGSIGREISLQLAAGGVRVMLVDLDEAKAQETAALIKERNVDCLVAVRDISKKDECEAVVKTAVDTWGRLDIIVNLAGIMRNASIKKITEEDWDATQKINLKGPMLLTQAAYDVMKAQHYGRIINIASPAYHGAAGQGAYAASKAGLVSYTMVTALEMARHGVTANVVCPGMVRTALTANVPEDFMEKITKSQPMGRLCLPSDVANCVVFFASDEAEYVSGQILTTSGGASVAF